MQSGQPGPLFSTEAEEAVLGSVLLDPSVLARVRATLKPSDFYLSKHAIVYGAVLDLRADGVPADLVTLIDRLERSGRLSDVGGAPAVMDLVNAVPTAIHGEYYADIVARLARDRRAVEYAGEVVKAAYAGKGEGIEVAGEMLRNMRSAGSARGNLRSMTEVVRDTMLSAQEAEEARRNGDNYDLYTGILPVDKYLVGGLFKGDVFVVAGQPGSRKSVLAHMAAHYAARVCGMGVLVFSTEMPGEQIAARALAAHAGVSSRMIQRGLMTGEQWASVMDTMPAVECNHLLVEDMVMNSGFLRDRVDEAAGRLDQMGHPLRLVVVDYLQMIRAENSRDRRVEVDAVLHDIKQMAKDYPFIVVSSIRRTESIFTKPSLRDALESSFIEFVATFGAVMWRDEGGTYYIEFQKSRDGGTGQEIMPPALPNQAWFNVRFAPPPSKGVQR